MKTPVKIIDMLQKKRTTSVELTPIAQEIKDQYVYLGLKNILSASLLLFSKHSLLDQISAIKVACGRESPDDLEVGKSITEKIKKVVSVIKEVRHDFDGRQPVGLDVQQFCNELLEILIIKKAAVTEPQRRKTLKDAFEIIKNTAKTKERGERIIIPDQETQALIDQIRKELGPDPKKRKKKKA